MALKAKSNLCQPKQNGGWGLKRFKHINSAILDKIGWMVLTMTGKTMCKGLK